MTALDVAPSWVLTTLRWLQSKGHISRVSTDGPAQLQRALKRLKFRFVELVELSEKPMAKADKDWKFTLDNQVSIWDEECHRQLREFLEEGGYDAESLKARGKAGDGEPTRSDLPDTELEKVERDLRPVSAHAPEQELQAAVEQERLVRDPRLGAW